MAVPPVGVKAVAMTLATQPEPAAALRASFTCTWPSDALNGAPATLLAIVPSGTVPAGLVIDKTPPVMVMVTSLALAAPADAEKTGPSSRAPAVTATSRRRRPTPSVVRAILGV